MTAGRADGELPVIQLPVIQLRKGRPDALESAALVAVIVAVARRRREAAGSPALAPATTRWHRPERSPGFHGPRTWRNPTD
ncbi:acyl-CoA carboxylase epsilon subunit [Frankia gtarii]|uniref:acyl-CoA carboxylase epsilon subunit n=1 Tax=Frankia gtarii TaxID=2950102 RepID=UPI0021C08CF9|nr:acyl-CoA carboxylase epsilon subunit [Frankia gtarii]